MRLNKQERERILKTLAPLLQTLQGPEVWLYGSQLDERVRGGDVDILLVAEDAPDTLRKRALGYESLLEDALDMPVDLLVYSRRSTTQPAVVQQAFATGQRLL
jgi:predicted nucleotidyltransferase